ncbi:MAG: YerC/YecD family TrpR-related protein [Clostridia bacterium]|nr:TrpR YerC/YecD [Candidatus Limimonas egerieequi]MCQ2489086.1 YerC/YecD family TrpR-related protein [Clostridia bacterium]
MALKGLNDESIEFLYDAVLELKDKEEAAKFFEDLCTVNELKSLSQRIVVAKMLTQHCVYSDIVAKTGASTATISRVNRSLSYGAGGYDDIFERLEKKEQK